MKNWKNIFVPSHVENLEDNPFKLIGDDWFLFTAGRKENFNTMTASWGSMGTFWNKPFVTCFIRPTRHTFSFIEESDVFTLSFFNESHRSVLTHCGSKSGRDTDKIADTGITPVLLKEGGISFEEARLVLECKKIYFDDLKPVFMLPDGIEEKIYPNKDYHRMYFGEIIGVYIK